MVTVWANPAMLAGTKPQDKSDVIFVDSRIAPSASPAPAGSVVPAGWIRQIASNGSIDTDLLMNGSYLPTITQFVVPYITGGWPPDPLAGQPGHTYTPPGGIST